MAKEYMVLGVIGAAATLISGGALAQCCPSGGTSPATKATTGLGEANPPARNLSADPAWRVYHFERDGINYVQVNDVYGKVHAAVGRVGDVAWVMPMGADADRVVVSPASDVGSVVYSSDDFIVRLVRGSDKPSWIVVPRRKN